MAIIIRALENGVGLPTGFPIVLDDQDRIIEPAFEYLLHFAAVSGRARASETVRTYAEHLYDWFDSLEQSALDWCLVDIDTIARYRNRMLQQPSAHTGRPFARSTVNARVQTVCRFYDWAADRGWLDERPFFYKDVRALSAVRAAYSTHFDGGTSTVKANVLTVPVYERLPRPLRPVQIEALYRCLPEPYRLVADWALATGMRRLELCALTVNQIPDSARADLDEQPVIGIPLAITKGGRPRVAYVPTRLVDKTEWYIGEARASLIKARKRRDRTFRASDTLFLNSLAEPVTKARLTAVFSRAFGDAGIVGTLHWLRHTFAMTLLVRLQARVHEAPDLNPLKIVQVLLGHASIETTSVYLQCVDLHEEAVVESVAYLYGEHLGDA